MKVLDLFSGIGGFSLGLERAGMETIAFCEIDKFCQKVLKKHWPNVPIYEDVRELNGSNISADVICGGFPCQPHSYSGIRKASKDSRDLWPEYARIISESKPMLVIAENVLGLLSSETGRYFARILSDLADLGYDAEWFNLPAGAIGAPHLRPRVWLVAYSNKTQLKRGGLSSGIYQEYTNTRHSRWGKDKSGVVRTSNGIPFQMDRVGALGNSVVPQIPEIIGRAIIKIESQRINSG